MSAFYRIFIFQMRRFLNLRYKYLNQIKFYLFGIEVGKNAVVHGYIGLKLAADSSV